jgi:hypothetical protein
MAGRHGAGAASADIIAINISNIKAINNKRVGLACALAKYGEKAVSRVA